LGGSVVGLLWLGDATGKFVLLLSRSGSPCPVAGHGPVAVDDLGNCRSSRMFGSRTFGKATQTAAFWLWSTMRKFIRTARQMPRLPPTRPYSPTMRKCIRTARQKGCCPWQPSIRPSEARGWQAHVREPDIRQSYPICQAIVEASRLPRSSTALPWPTTPWPFVAR
jgi:hypothetical protein